MRRDFTLPAEDMEWLTDRGGRFELVSSEGALRAILYDVDIPAGYNVSKADVYFRIEPGYPDAQIDMAYFAPNLSLSSGRQIGALTPDNFDGKVWQRWSRHRTPANPWRPGVDSIATHFVLMQDWLERELRKP
jgi:hypothetical protein